MTDVKQPLSSSEKTNNPVEKIVQYLFYNPCDLIDACRLMKHFRASAADVQCALGRLEQLKTKSEEQSPPSSQKAEDLAEKIVFHLLRYPFDLVDTRRLMRRFQASGAEVQHALGQFSQLMLMAEGEERASSESLNRE